MIKKAQNTKIEFTDFNDLDSFKKLFLEYYRPLTIFAFSYVKNSDTAKDIVQELFIKIWEKRNEVKVKQDVKAYLYQCVKNACLTFIQTKGKIHLSLESVDSQKIENTLMDQIISIETEERIFTAIEELPPQCKTIFKLSRFEKMKYSDISKKLGLSVKTIENQIGSALKKLARLKHILTMFFLVFI